MSHECVVAVGGKQGASQESQPSVILADWLMPSLSGLELCPMIRADRRVRYSYVILVTDDVWVRAGRIAVELELASTAVRSVYQESGQATPLRHQGWDPGAVWPCRRLAWPFP
jgi:DNA-binding NarL/FixJ family response regulator